jgi:hypothetical protein
MFYSFVTTTHRYEFLGRADIWSVDALMAGKEVGCG